MRRRKIGPAWGSPCRPTRSGALDVIDWVAAVARQTGRRMAVRLVKGAYWDSEIKRSQERGLEGYPVYTRKITNPTFSYLACVGRLFRHGDVLFPQFATHNAHSIAAVLELAPRGASYEFQRLHGMGRLLYAEAERQIAGFPPVRVYAPVGEHKDLLAYLVRRLLENGANTSFVNRFMDEQVPVLDIVRDPITELERLDAYAHPRLPAPVALYADRRNSVGLDLGNPATLETARAGIASRRMLAHTSVPLIDGVELSGETLAVTNPADRRDIVGRSRDATGAEIRAAFDAAGRGQHAWDARGGGGRAECLDRGRRAARKVALRFLRSLDPRSGKDPAGRDLRGARGKPIFAVTTRYAARVPDCKTPTVPLARSSSSAPTGVGKTELTKALASFLFDDGHRDGAYRHERVHGEALRGPSDRRAAVSPAVARIAGRSSQRSSVRIAALSRQFSSAPSRASMNGPTEGSICGA